MIEIVDGNTTKPVFVFGENSAATAGDYSSYGMGNEEMSAAPTGNTLRIVMDELLLGNYLEEIQCNGLVDDDKYAMVPVGATPDDIARCAVGADLLPTTCPGSNPLSVCICQRDAGCTIDETSPAIVVPKGQSVGILDANEDGSVDDTRFIEGAVGIRCGTADVAIDLDNSYWNPSGDQQKPAMGGFDALGPAIVLKPSAAMPTDADCGLVFSPDVVDDTNIQVCAPPNGDVTQDCTPGDTSAFKFHTVPLGIKTGATPNNNDPAYDPSLPVILYSVGNVPFDPTTLAGITVHNDTLDVDVPYTLTLAAMNTSIQINLTGGLQPLTMYTITFPTTITDAYGQPLPTPFVLTFTTGA